VIRAAIFANGEITNKEAVKSEVRDDDLIIAADGGLRHIYGLGLKPNIVVGDLDSAPNELQQLARTQGAEIIPHPERKDATDLELALCLARDRGASAAVVFGSLGGRLDHALANVLLLSSTTVSGMAVHMLEAGYELFVTPGEVEIVGQPGDLVTLLALTETAREINTSGLEYPLVGGILYRGSSQGVSNVMVEDRAHVRVGDGCVLIIHLKAEQQEDKGPRRDDEAS